MSLYSGGGFLPLLWINIYSNTSKVPALGSNDCYQAAIYTEYRQLSTASCSSIPSDYFKPVATASFVSASNFCGVHRWCGAISYSLHTCFPEESFDPARSIYEQHPTSP